MKRFLAAVQFLTVIPVPYTCDERDLGRSALLFPVIGLLIGAGMLVINIFFGAFFPPLVGNVLLVIAMVAVSGGLHMDGLADTADGFFSARPRDRVLEIMKDSRTGVMGVIAVASVLSLKMAALISVPPGLRGSTLLLMPLAGRCALVIELAALPYARPEGGLGALFGADKSRWDPVFAVAVLAAVAGWASGLSGLVTTGAVVAITLIFSWWCRQKIGGFTGDTLGAACELAELVPALVAAARAH